LKTLWFESERALSAFAAGASLVVAVTCSGRAELGPKADSALDIATGAPAGSVVPTPGETGAAPASSVGPVVSPRAPTAGAQPVPLPSPRLFAALSALEKNQRNDHVRILWLGDSHTAADFMGSAVREGLKRFKSGGPGHLLIGMKPYRHGMVKSELIGAFRLEPSAPAMAQRQGDGVFGLAGVRTVPETWEARALLTPYPRSVRGRARWEIIYRLPRGASFRVRLGSEQNEVNGKTKSAKTAPGLLPRIAREGAASDPMEITAAYASPQLFGAILEGSEPGLVIDTLGINGARASTPLSWDERTFTAEVRARAPEAFVIAYGTNEAFDARAAERVAEPLRSLVELLRRAAPRADCLIVGPPDAADPSGASHPRIALVEAAQQTTAQELGCAFFSLRAAMGGEGSFARWAKEKPPLAGLDRVHLTPAGYAKLGEALSRALLESYAVTALRGTP
jgi:lysophospholipase L1-like esterase